MTKTYPSNLTWEQWELISDLFPEAKLGGVVVLVKCQFMPY